MDLPLNQIHSPLLQNRYLKGISSLVSSVFQLNCCTFPSTIKLVEFNFKFGRKEKFSTSSSTLKLTLIPKIKVLQHEEKIISICQSTSKDFRRVLNINKKAFQQDAYRSLLDPGGQVLSRIEMLLRGHVVLPITESDIITSPVNRMNDRPV